MLIPGRSDRYTQDVFRGLDDSERTILDAMRSRSISRPPNRVIAAQGEIGIGLLVVSEGWAMRYREADGRRQIVDFLLPGEIIGLQAALLGVMEHSARSLTALQLSVFETRLVRESFEKAPNLALRLARYAAAEACRIEEMMTVIGCGEALERIGYLMLSLYRRQSLHREVDPRDCPFPLRRQHLADALGLTGAHINRMLNRLRDEGIAAVHGRRLQILDLPRLEQIAGLNSAAPG